MDSAALTIVQHFQNTLSPVQAVRLSAEKALVSSELAPGFSIVLLQVVSAPDLDPSIRITAAVYFKNFVKKHWKQVEGEPDKIASTDRMAIKANIVDLMISAHHQIQLQLSEAVTMIADNDFPDQWSELIPLLVSKLDANNFDINAGVLQTAHSIFKRWRHQVASNALFSEIKLVLEQFAAPFLAFFQATDALVDANSGNTKQLAVLFNVVHLLTKIFYSLNCQDYPEFFENNHEKFMALLKKYLLYKNPALETSDDSEPGPIEKVKSSICEIIDLYGSKYEEDFVTLPDFVSAVWGLLTTTGLEPKYDERRVLRQRQYNLIVFADADTDLFEDEPMEYIRRDLEGSDAGTRRGAATDLIRGLLAHFSQETTEIISGYLSVLLADYAKNPKLNWKSKDSALYLMIAVSAKAWSLQSGVTIVNEHIDTVSVFASNVFPDLQAPVNGTTELIIKVDALKYVLTFRNQMTKEQILEVFPLLVDHLFSTNPVVYTYSAVCIERILAMRAGPRAMFVRTDIQGHTERILLRLLDLIQIHGTSTEKLAENDYLMKALMRVTAVARDAVTSFVSQLLTRLTQIIEAISRNPSNPKFNHYSFETIGVLIRSVCQNNNSLVSEFESFLFPPFQGILQQDVAEFMPYVFQIMSQMLSMHKEGGIPHAYSVMLPPLLTPVLWESHGNIPALVGLLGSYLSKGSTQIIQSNQLIPILGVYHKLISSRMNDNYGMDLILSVYENVPSADLAAFNKNIFTLLLKRLDSSRTAKFVRCFLKFLCSLFAMQKNGINPDAVISIFDNIQPLLFKNLFLSVLVGGFGEMVPANERKLYILGLTNMLTGSNTLLSDDYLALWIPTIEIQKNLIEIPTAQDADVIPEDELYIADVEEAGYQASFSRLSTPASSEKNMDALLAGVDAKTYFLQRMQVFRASPLAGRVPPQVFAAIGINA
ncbi:Exportin-2 [Entophlyctis luteolus]|nr:Exportin-2 [Entophlyctis luteolus]